MWAIELSLGTLVGHEGTTGSSTGVHLHLEMQDLTNRGWIFGAPLSDYLNPADFMGFPNTPNISVIYNGTPGPGPGPGPGPEPQPSQKNAKKWLMSKTFRLNIKI